MICGLLFRLTAAPPVEHLLDVWDTENKLPNSTVTAIAQSGDGYLWIGTYNGLARFDGVRFVTYDPVNTPELGHARVQELARDATGTLWISTYLGELTSYRDGRFHREWDGTREYDTRTRLVWSSSNVVMFVTPSGDLLRREIRSAGGRAVSSKEASQTGPDQWDLIAAPGRLRFQFAEAAGVLWFIDREGGIVRFEDGRFRALSSPDGSIRGTAQVLAPESPSLVWIGTDVGIFRWDGQKFTDQSPTNDSLAGWSPSMLMPTLDGGVWTLSQGRLRKAKHRSWVDEKSAWEGLLGNASGRIMGVHRDRSGTIWFSHYGNGVFYIRPDGTARRLTTRDGLPGDRIWAWFETPEGDIWLGVDRGGLVRLRQRQFDVIGTREGLPVPGVLSVCGDPAGSVYLGTAGGGLLRLRSHADAAPGGPARFDRFDTGGSASENLVFSILPLRKGGLLLSAAAGEDLFEFRDDKLSRGPWDVHGIKALIEDRHGRVWFGTKNGLAWYDSTQRRVFGSADGVGSSPVRAFAETSDGTIWCGADDGTLYRCHPDRVERFRTTDSLSNQPIWSLHADVEGVIWAGTFRGGLLRWKDGRFARLGTRQGLPNDIISQILEDTHGHVWLGTHQGICRIEKPALVRCADGLVDRMDVVNFGRLDGLPTLECASSYQPACWHGDDGRLWFATIKGVVAVRPEQLTINPVPPPVVIEDFRVDSTSLDLRAHSQGVEPGHRQFEFQFTALSFSAPDKVRFRYRLEGLERDWVEADGDRTVQYNHLRPGKYVFRVIACNNDGVWNSSGASHAFTVLPRFYQTWWFTGLISLIVLGAVAGLVRGAAVRKYRRALALLEQQNAIERDRARIARDIHDDLGAGLTQITLLSELARRDSPQKLESHLDQICGSARQLTRAMDEIVWAVDPQHDTLAGFVDYASAFAEEFLRVAGIRCRWDLPALIPAIHVEAEIRYHLFLALKEALNNVVKHARATEVWIRLRLLPDGFELVLEDDGQGITTAGEISPQPAPDRISSGHGIDNLEKRLSAVGGRCEVRSEPGRGTQIGFVVSLPVRSAIARGEDHAAHSGQ